MAQNKIIQIIGFQGASRRYPQYLNEHPLILFGHVGIKFEDDPIIYGFHPTQKTIENLGGIDVFREHMKDRKPISGTFQDDTLIFHRAYELTSTRSLKFLQNDPHRLEVYAINFSFEPERYMEIQTKLNSWYTQNKEWAYLFPPINGDDLFDNCATVPRHLGIPVPAFEEHQGYLRLYITFFKAEGELWKPT